MWLADPLVVAIALGVVALVVAFGAVALAVIALRQAVNAAAYVRFLEEEATHDPTARRSEDPRFTVL